MQFLIIIIKSFLSNNIKAALTLFQKISQIFNRIVNLGDFKAMQTNRLLHFELDCPGDLSCPIHFQIRIESVL